MAKVEVPTENTTAEPEGVFSCGHDHGELPEELREILAVREIYYENPAEFRHDQVPFLGFEVDSKLRTIIENLWLMELPTDFSCEGYIELCHPELMSSEFHSQIVFLRIRDAVRFYVLIAELFGAGTLFGPEGFSLHAMDGAIDQDSLGNPQNNPDYFRLLHENARGEVTFHPSYIEYFVDMLDSVTSIGELDAKRSELEIAESLDEAYEILAVSPELRELAERSCDCGHEH